VFEAPKNLKMLVFYKRGLHCWARDYIETDKEKVEMEKETLGQIKKGRNVLIVGISFSVNSKTENRTGKENN
jgi:hypothetical protein